MRAQTIKLIRNWRAVLLLTVIPALTNCSKLEGTAELRSSTGEAYSFAGAKVEAFDLNPAVVLPGGTKVPKGIGSVGTDDGAITLQVVTATIDDNALYDVEIRCPANNTTDACNVESPLHVVLNGAQLMAGGWTITALTEIAFQNIAYYAATAYSADEITQILENNANALLVALPGGVQKTYDDLIAWSTAETDAIKRVDLINTISESLAAGIADGDLKVLAQQAVSAELSSINMAAYPALDGWIIQAQLSDGYAYLLGENMPLTIIDIRDPNAIAPIGAIAEHVNGPFTVAGDFAYVVGSDELTFNYILFVVDISNRQQPQTTGQLEIIDSLSAIAASGGYVYAGRGDVLNIIDATDPATPTVVGTLSITSDDLLASGSHVYVSNAAGISIVDVSAPSAPLVVGSLATPRPPSHITIIGDYAYVTVPGAATSDPVQLLVVGVSNPAAPTVITELTLATGTARLTVIGTRAYADGSATTQILDISNAAAPVLADSFANASPGIRLNDSAFFTYGVDIVSIIDPSITAQPIVQSGNAALEGRTSGLAASGRYVYVPRDDWGFDVYDLIDPLAPALIESLSDGHLFGSIVISGNVAFLGDIEYGGVETADISNPAEPLLHFNNVRLHETGDELFGIRQLFLSGNTIFVPWGYAALDIGTGIGVGARDCTNPNVDGGVGGLFAVDVSTIEIREPLQIASHICMPEEARTVAVNGNYAYVGVADKTLRVVDFTDTTAPALTGSVNLFAPANSISLVGGYLWVTEGDGGIEIFNISTPQAPVFVTHIAVPGATTSIEIEGNLVYVAAGLSGVHIFDIGNPMLPRLVGSVSTDLPALSAFVEDGYLYATTLTGLEIFKAFPGSL